MSDNSSKTKELFFDLTMSDDGNQLQKDIAQAEEVLDAKVATEVSEKVEELTETITTKEDDVLPELKKGVRETTLDLTGELDLSALLQVGKTEPTKTASANENVATNNTTLEATGSTYDSITTVEEIETVLPFSEQKASLDVDRILANLEKNLDAIESLSSDEVEEKVDLELTNPFLSTETMETILPPSFDDVEKELPDEVSIEVIEEPATSEKSVMNEFKINEVDEVENVEQLDANEEQETLDSIVDTITEEDVDVTQVMEPANIEVDSNILLEDVHIEEIVTNPDTDSVLEDTVNVSEEEPSRINEQENIILTDSLDNELEKTSFDEHNEVKEMNETIEDEVAADFEEIEVVMGSSQVSTFTPEEQTQVVTNLDEVIEKTIIEEDATIEDEHPINIEEPISEEKVSVYHPKSVFEELEEIVEEETKVEFVEPAVDVELDEEATTLDALLERLTKITELELENFSENSTLPKRNVENNDSPIKDTIVEPKQEEIIDDLINEEIDKSELHVENINEGVEQISETVEVVTEEESALIEEVNDVQESEEVSTEKSTEESEKTHESNQDDKPTTMQFSQSLQELESLMEDVDNLTAKIHEKTDEITEVKQSDVAELETEIVIEDQSEEDIENGDAITLPDENMPTVEPKPDTPKPYVFDAIVTTDSINDVNLPSTDELVHDLQDILVDPIEKTSKPFANVDIEKESKSIHPVNRGALEINLDESIDLLNIPTISLDNHIDVVAEETIVNNIPKSSDLLVDDVVESPFSLIENELSASDLIFLDSDIDELSLTQPLVFSETDNVDESTHVTDEIVEDEVMQPIDESTALAALVSSISNETIDDLETNVDSQQEISIKEAMITASEDVNYEDDDLVDVDTKEFLREQFSEITATLELEELNEQIAEAKEQLDEIQNESDEDERKEKRINGLMVLTKVLIAVLIILIPMSMKIIFTSSGTLDGLLNHSLLYPVLIGIIIAMFIPDVVRLIKGSK